MDMATLLTVAKRLVAVSVYIKTLAVDLRISEYVSSPADFSAGTIVIFLPSEKLVDWPLPGRLGS